MLSRISSASITGIQAAMVTVEVDATQGLPGEVIVGLPDTVIRESKNRIRHALRNAGFHYPIKSYTINLAPADLKKEGAFFDLPISVGILTNTGQIRAIKDALYVGELALNGDVLPVRGIISIAECALAQGMRYLVCPYENAGLAQLVQGLTILPIRHLSELSKLSPNTPMHEVPPIDLLPSEHQDLDMDDVKGQWMAKRVLEIAASGKHNVLLVGSPGSGKSMLIKRFPGLLPDLNPDEVVERVKLLSLCNARQGAQVSLGRPFRQPHHSVSYAGLVGGGKSPRPGEISMAHLGVLFLDELPEFRRDVIEVLRQPLEDRSVSITRATFSVTYPADIILAAAMNPCPCGYSGDPKINCQCNPTRVQQYLKKLSGPLLDRIDLILTIPRLSQEDMLAHNTQSDQYSTHAMKQRIHETRQRQLARNQHNTLNANLSPKDIAKHCQVTEQTKSLLGKALDKGLLSGRSYHKVLKIARTIADLEGADHIETGHVTEAMQYRKTSLT